MGSYVDRVFRSILLTKFFSKGWGTQNSVKKLIRFRAIVNKSGLNALLDPLYPVNCKKEIETKKLDIFSGSLVSPLAKIAPDLLPPPIDNAVFKMVIPRQWNREDGLKPLCIHLAGTGDHGPDRRLSYFASPLADNGIGSIILENPFYGVRKPADQSRSCLRYVTDLFIMGAALMMECGAILQWAEKEGYGPFCLTGISLGGYMACLSATVWPKPISLVPYLSWTTASSAYTRGVIAGAIPWNRLSAQIPTPEFQESFSMLNSPVNTTRRSQLVNGCLDATTEDALRAMEMMMDEFTHLANYPRPKDPSLIISVVAEHDAYIPRDTVMDLQELWPEIEVRTIPGKGHIQAAIFAHFRGSLYHKAVIEALDRNIAKYFRPSVLSSQG